MKNYADDIQEASMDYQDGFKFTMFTVLRDLILEALHEGSSMEYRMNKGRTADDIVKEALDGL